MLTSLTLEVPAFKVAHAAERRACMESEVCPKSIDWDQNHIGINRAEDLISLVLVKITRGCK